MHWEFQRCSFQVVRMDLLHMKMANNVGSLCFLLIIGAKRTSSHREEIKYAKRELRDISAILIVLKKCFFCFHRTPSARNHSHDHALQRLREFSPGLHWWKTDRKCDLGSRNSNYASVTALFLLITWVHPSNAWKHLTSNASLVDGMRNSPCSWTA